MDWYRCYHGAPHDPKLHVIAKKAGVARGDVAAIWWAVLDHASQAEVRGSVADLDIEQISYMFEYSPSTCSIIVQLMYDRGLIAEDGMVAKWQKRQPIREDSSTGRVRAFRERNDETQCNARTEKNRTEQSREEEFAAWYAAFPLHVGKARARKAYEAARKKASAEQLLAGIETYRRIKPDYADWSHPASWLNGDRWLDEAPQKPARKVTNGQAGPMVYVEPWAQRLKAFRASGRWDRGQFGPPPGEPGCRVPAELIGAPMPRETRIETDIRHA